MAASDMINQYTTGVVHIQLQQAALERPSQHQTGAWMRHKPVTHAGIGMTILALHLRSVLAV